MRGSGIAPTNSQFAVMFGAVNFLCFSVLLFDVRTVPHEWLQWIESVAWSGQEHALLGIFWSMALSLAATAILLRNQTDSLLLIALLGGSAIAFLGAGWCQLHFFTQGHGLLLLLAFALAWVAMVLFPHKLKGFYHTHIHRVSWSMAGVIILLLGCGMVWLPLFVAQSLAAGVLLLWLLWLTLFVSFQKN